MSDISVIDPPVQESVIEDKSNFHSDVKKAIVEALPQVKEKVVKHYVNRELEKLESLVLKTLESVDSDEKALRKLKPDNVVLDRNGKTVSEGYTQSTVKSIKELEEKIKKQKEALEAALGNNDYEKLKKLG